jgi:hypothetical protein
LTHGLDALTTFSNDATKSVDDRELNRALHSSCTGDGSVVRDLPRLSGGGGRPTTNSSVLGHSAPFRTTFPPLVHAKEHSRPCTEPPRTLAATLHKFAVATRFSLPLSVFLTVAMVAF